MAPCETPNGIRNSLDVIPNNPLIFVIKIEYKLEQKNFTKPRLTKNTNKNVMTHWIERLFEVGLNCKCHKYCFSTRIRLMDGWIIVYIDTHVHIYIQYIYVTLFHNLNWPKTHKNTNICQKIVPLDYLFEIQMLLKKNADKWFKIFLQCVYGHRRDHTSIIPYTDFYCFREYL